MGDRALDLLDGVNFRSHLYWDLNPCQRGSMGNNCYAAASAFFAWLSLGRRTPAVCIELNQGLVLTPDQWRQTTLPQLMRIVLRDGHGSQVIVQGIRPPRSRFTADHAFNLVNIDPPNGIKRPNSGSVHLVDAYTNVLIPDMPSPSFDRSRLEIEAYLQHNQIVRLGYRTDNYSVRVVP